MFILKGVKVLCFDTLLQVLILKVVSREMDGPLFGLKKTGELALLHSGESMNVKFKGSFRDSRRTSLRR